MRLGGETERHSMTKSNSNEAATVVTAKAQPSRASAIGCAARITLTLIFCLVANYMVAKDMPDYLKLVRLGNIQMFGFYFIVWAIQSFASDVWKASRHR